MRQQQMVLEDFGYNSNLEKYRKTHSLDNFKVGRVISEHKERYVVKTDKGDFDAEIIGALRFSAKNRSDFPAVGDWVAISEYDENKMLIHNIFPRKTIIERKTVGKFGQKQIIATNLDYIFIVQAVDRDFNINRLERYLTICNTSQVKPIIILSKIDLIHIDTLEETLDTVAERIKQIPVFAISNKTLSGYDKLTASIKKGETYCLLGSSGVGKSTLLNNLSGKILMKTGTISLSTKKGQHITSHRELFVLDNGGIFIDTPGMREIGIADNTNALEATFNAIVALADSCKFTDCTHIHEGGCAVLGAIESGDIGQAAYDNYLKILREKTHFESSIVEKRRKDKALGKMIRNYKNLDKSHNR